VPRLKSVQVNPNLHNGATSHPNFENAIFNAFIDYSSPSTWRKGIPVFSEVPLTFFELLEEIIAAKVAKSLQNKEVSEANPTKKRKSRVSKPSAAVTKQSPSS